MSFIADTAFRIFPLFLFKTSISKNLNDQMFFLKNSKKRFLQETSSWCNNNLFIFYFLLLRINYAYISFSIIHFYVIFGNVILFEIVATATSQNIEFRDADERTSAFRRPDLGQSWTISDYKRCRNIGIFQRFCDLRSFK